MTFGQSAEKLALQIEQLELALEELEGEAEVADSRTADRAPAERVSPVRALPDPLPRAERRIEPEAGRFTCPACGGALRPLGADIYHHPEISPVKWRVLPPLRPNAISPPSRNTAKAPGPVKAQT